MTNDNDYLEKIGKKMPYSIPEGLFERVQNNVLKQIEEMEEEKQLSASKEKLQKQQKTKKPFIRRLTIAITTIAASVCAVCMLYFGSMGNSNGNNTHQLSKQQQATSTSAVDKAYDNLSQEEQENLLADYSNDIYMSLQ